MVTNWYAVEPSWRSSLPLAQHRSRSTSLQFMNNTAVFVQLSTSTSPPRHHFMAKISAHPISPQPNPPWRASPTSACTARTSSSPRRRRSRADSSSLSGIRTAGGRGGVVGARAAGVAGEGEGWEAAGGVGASAARTPAGTGRAGDGIRTLRVSGRVSRQLERARRADTRTLCLCG